MDGVDFCHERNGDAGIVHLILSTRHPTMSLGANLNNDHELCHAY